MKENSWETVLVLHNFKNMMSYLILQFTGSGETSLLWFSWSGLLFWHCKGCWCIEWKTLPSSGSCLGLTPLCCVLPSISSWCCDSWWLLEISALECKWSGYILPWLWGMGERSKSAALPSPAWLRRDWCWENVAAPGCCLCTERALLLFHEHSAVLCHLAVSLRSLVAAWHRDVPDCRHNTS